MFKNFEKNKDDNNRISETKKLQAKNISCRVSEVDCNLIHDFSDG